MDGLPSTPKNLIRPLNNNHGVTLPEILVYMVITGILLAAAVMTFMGQNSSYNKQDVVAEIQQNVRGATEKIVADVRFAGMGLIDKPQRAFQSANHDWLQVNHWDGGLVPRRYRLVGTDLIQDPGTASTADDLVIATNIEEFRLNYLYDDDETAAEDWQWAVSAQDLLDTIEFADESEEPNNINEALELIRAVKIVILAGARSSAFNPTDTIEYSPPIVISTVGGTLSDLPWIPDPGTGYKQLVTVTAQCRNNLE